MNKSIRVSAKTVDDAVIEALVQLGITSDQLEYEVIEKGSAGFLGIGMKQAVIEARRKAVKEEPAQAAPEKEDPEKKEIRKDHHRQKPKEKKERPVRTEPEKPAQEEVPVK